VEVSFTHDPNDGVLWNATYGIDANESIGQARFYHIRVPVSLPLDDFLLMPLVIQLHGGGGNASNFEQTTKLGGAAAARGYIVVYGEGIDLEFELGMHALAVERLPMRPVHLNDSRQTTATTYAPSWLT